MSWAAQVQGICVSGGYAVVVGPQTVATCSLNALARLWEYTVTARQPSTRLGGSLALPDHGRGFSSRGAELPNGALILWKPIAETSMH